MNKPAFDKELFSHWKKIPIRFRDLDPLNHVNNAIFCTYYEEARVAFIQNVPVFQQEMENGFSFVLANINIDFIRPVEYPAELLIGSGITELGKSSITSFQAIYHAKTKELVSVAEASGVWFDLKKQKPAPVPEIDGVEKFMMEV